MPYYGFKLNPKQLVEAKAKRLFGRDIKVTVTGLRPSEGDCRLLGIPTGTYSVGCVVNGVCIANAHARNWRKAYKLLVIEVEKAFEASLHAV